MANLEKAVSKMIELVTDESHGYSQSARTGPDYDCSSSIYFALKAGGFDLPASPWATSNMVAAMKARGWTQVGTNWGSAHKTQLKRGDILVNPGRHTEMYIGDGQMAGFNLNELGKITGGKPGDQTGKESSIKPYAGTWAAVMRYAEPAPAAGPKHSAGPAVNDVPPVPRTIDLRNADKKTVTGPEIETLQVRLRAHGYQIAVDGYAGLFTKMTLGSFQRQAFGAAGVDYVAGPNTWRALLAVA